MTTNPSTDRMRERLRSLASFDPPAGGWIALQRRRDMRARRRRWIAASSALAASLLLSVGLARLNSASPSVARSASTSADIAALMSRSRTLEARLAELRPRIWIWDDHSAHVAAALEREISIVDVQLGSGDVQGDRRLWQNRVDLLSTLVRTHREAEWSNASFQVPAESDL